MPTTRKTPPANTRREMFLGQEVLLRFVESSAVAAMGWCEVERVRLRGGKGFPVGNLYVVYSNGVVYRYRRVARSVWRALHGAESHGTAINQLLLFGSGEAVGVAKVTP